MPHGRASAVVAGLFQCEWDWKETRSGRAETESNRTFVYHSHPIPPDMNFDNASPKSHRLWFPFGLVLLATAGIVAFNLQPKLERSFPIWMTAAIFQLAVLFGLVWLVFLSRLRWRKTSFPIFSGV